ncbi:hypothetical protein V6N13_028179 [Hibiscus sabdariffa]
MAKVVGGFLYEIDKEISVAFAGPIEEEMRNHGGYGQVEATNKGTNDAHAKAKMERGIAVKSVVKTLRIHVKLKDKVEVFSNIKMIVNQLRFVNVRVEAISVQGDQCLAQFDGFID